MNSTWIWVTIAGLTASTFLTRAGFLLLGDRVNLPTWLERALRYAPACALTAIVLPELVYAKGTLDLSFGNDRLVAAALACGFFVATRSLLGTIVFGMAAFTLLRLFV